MSFHQTREVTYDYCLNGLPLDCGNQAKDLSILYTPSFEFRSHIDYIINTSLRVFGFIRRFYKFYVVNCLLVFYKRVGRYFLY